VKNINYFSFLKTFNYGLIIDSNEKNGTLKKIPSLFPPATHPLIPKKTPRGVSHYGLAIYIKKVS
jgi:hypothetical protein